MKDCVCDAKETKPVYGAYLNVPRGFQHDFYLSGEIEGPEVYSDWFNAIRYAGENDIVTIHINSPGGLLVTALQFVSIIQDTAATVVASVEGECASAATLIFLASDSFISSPHSMFMFHTYSGGTSGKGQEMFDQIVYEKKWSEKIFQESYKGILSKEEIENMVAGKDFWLTAEEVIGRILNKIESEEKKAAKKEKKTSKKEKKTSKKEKKYVQKESSN